jgi:hypothetical protein
MHLFGQIVSDTTMHRIFWGAAATIRLLALGRAEFALQITLWLALATAQLMIAVATAICPLILVLVLSYRYVLSAVVCTVGLPFDALGGSALNTCSSPGYGGTGVMMAAIRYMDTDHWLRVRRCSIVPVSCIVLEKPPPPTSKGLDDHLLSGVFCYGYDLAVGREAIRCTPWNVDC